MNVAKQPLRQSILYISIVTVLTTMPYILIINKIGMKSKIMKSKRATMGIMQISNMRGSEEPNEPNGFF
jgi:hypothetical protein